MMFLPASASVAARLAIVMLLPSPCLQLVISSEPVSPSMATNSRLPRSMRNASLTLPSGLSTTARSWLWAIDFDTTGMRPITGMLRISAVSR